jgi:hypothetical protein
MEHRVLLKIEKVEPDDRSGEKIAIKDIRKVFPIN